MLLLGLQRLRCLLASPFAGGICSRQAGPSADGSWANGRNGAGRGRILRVTVSEVKPHRTRLCVRSKFTNMMMKDGNKVLARSLMTQVRTPGSSRTKQKAGTLLSPLCL